MTLVTLRDAQLSYGGPSLLDATQLAIESRERVCLVGRNGEGKTTLLRVLNDEAKLDSGECIRRQGLTWATLPQAIPSSPSGTVYEVVATGLGAIGKLWHERNSCTDDKRAAALDEAIAHAEAWDGDRQIRQITTDVGLQPDSLMERLSGGQIRRALLASALVNSPDLLILDEPTNHLDLDSILWLENLLAQFSGSVVFTTHDRAFLQRVATRIVELDRGELTSWPGDYANYLRRRDERQNAEALDAERESKKLAEEETWIRQGIKARRTRNEGRVRALKALREKVKARRHKTGNATFGVQQAEESGRRVFEVESLSKSFGELNIVDNLSTIIQRGDKVGIIGPNGVGKTTLIQLLLGQLEPDSGSVETGTRLEIGYFDQRRAALDESARVADWVADNSDTVTVNGQSKHIISYLGDFLFAPNRARGPISALSGGERNRLVLARLFAKPTNLLVLDEPTNDLDIETLELLEELLADYSGTVLLTSHDRAFLDNVVTSSLVFEGEGVVREYPGGYSDWLALKPTVKQAPKDKPRKEKTSTANAGNSKAKPAKLSYKETRELEELPAQLEALEAELEALREKLADPQTYKDAPDTVSEQVAALEAGEARLETMFERWAELDEKR